MIALLERDSPPSLSRTPETFEFVGRVVSGARTGQEAEGGEITSDVYVAAALAESTTPGTQVVAAVDRNERIVFVLLRLADGSSVFGGGCAQQMLMPPIEAQSNSVEILAKLTTVIGEDLANLAIPGSLSPRETAVADQPWFVSSDTRLCEDEIDRSKSEILETVEFASIDGQDTIRLHSGCNSNAQVVVWGSDGFTTGEILENQPGPRPCGDNFENFATSTISPGTLVEVTLADDNLVLTTSEEAGGWTLELSQVSLRLQNEIGQQLLQSDGWQYHDGAGPIDRSGISFPSDGSDESLRFTSDETPADILTLVTGCKVAAYRIVWNEDGFIIKSTFTSKGPTDDQACDFVATEGLVVTPFSFGEQILVQRESPNRVILTPADSGQQPWTISLLGR